MRLLLSFAFTVGLVLGAAPTRAAGPSVDARIERARARGASLRAQPDKLRYRHHIERLIRDWRRALRVATRGTDAFDEAQRGHAEAWALMAHWSGRADDARTAAKLKAELSSRPVVESPAAPEVDTEVDTEVETEVDTDAPLAPAEAPIVDDGDTAASSAWPEIDVDAEVATLVRAFAPAATPTLRRSTVRAAQPRQADLLPIRRVLIDAGHGGEDDGAIGPHGLREKDVNLAIATRLGAALRAKGLEVVYTRASDVFVSLAERTRIAHEFDADLFVSVHANANPRDHVHGIETYYLNTTSHRYSRRLALRENGASGDLELPDPEDPSVELAPALPDGDLGRDLRLILADLAMRSATTESRRLAGYVQRSLVHQLSRRYEDVKDLGVKHALFYVLLGARMPAVLVETGFVSHAEESKRLGTTAYQARVADSIAAGVSRFVEERARLAARARQAPGLVRSGLGGVAAP